MSWPMLQVAILTGMTNTVRTVGDRFGPRWGGLLLGLPSTTAVLLVTGGWEHGRGEAARASEIALLGLVAAVALPLAYGGAVSLGWGRRGSILAAVVGYLASAGILRAGPDFGAWGGLVLAVAGVTLGCRLARRLPEVESGPVRDSPWRLLALRGAVPAAFVLGMRGLRTVVGPEWSRMFATFPAMSLAVLVTLHIEGGPGAALGMARSMPRGNLGMIAFLAAFRATCPTLGPLSAAVIGYVAVLATMAWLIRIDRDEPYATIDRSRRVRRRFAPAVEAFGWSLGPKPGDLAVNSVAAALVRSLDDKRGDPRASRAFETKSVTIRINVSRAVATSLARKVA
jgi:hypothetical protein